MKMRVLLEKAASDSAMSNSQSISPDSLGERDRETEKEKKERDRDRETERYREGQETNKDHCEWKSKCFAHELG